MNNLNHPLIEVSDNSFFIENNDDEVADAGLENQEFKFAQVFNS
jgi:hypothetical protein